MGNISLITSLRRTTKGKFFPYLSLSGELRLRKVCGRATEKNVFGLDGQKMQAQVWKEVLAILEETVPQVKEIVSSSAAA